MDTPKQRTACVRCRGIKIKCLPFSEDSLPSDKCARCTRLKSECLYTSLKRGRKPGPFARKTKLKVGDGSDPLALALSTAAAGPPDLSLNSDLTSQFSESASVGSNSLRGVDGEAWEGRRQANLVRDGVGFETIEGIKGDGEQVSSSRRLSHEASQQPPFASSSSAPYGYSNSFEPSQPPFGNSSSCSNAHASSSSRQSQLVCSPLPLPPPGRFPPFPFPSFSPGSAQPHLRYQPEDSAASGSSLDPSFFRPESFLRGPQDPSFPPLPQPNASHHLSPPTHASLHPHQRPQDSATSSFYQQHSLSTGSTFEGNSDAGSTSREREGRGALSFVEMLSDQAGSHRTATGVESSRGNASEMRNVDDAVAQGLLAEAEVSPLFDAFHSGHNQLACQLDPFLHTPTYTRSSSPLLFAAVLVAATKVERPELYPGLLSFASELLRQNIFLSPSVHTIQAISILCFSKEATDSGSWRRIGFAIRLAIELELHLPHQRPLPEDELEARLVLNRERIWIQLNLFDQTLTLQQGRPPMITDPEWAPNVRRWALDHQRFDSGAEGLLCGSWEIMTVGLLAMSIRSASRHVKRMLLPHQARLLKEFRESWTDERPVVPVSEKGQRILGFLYRLFYFDFTILQLSVHVRITQNSTMSAASLQDPPIEDPEGTSRTVNNTKDSILALGTSVEAAMDLVQFLVDQLASILPIAQDIITIGVASAAVFLARNAQRVGRGGELTTLLLQAARTCRSAVKNDASMAAYQSRFFLSLVHASSKPPSRIGSPQLGSKGPSLRTVDLSLLDFQLDGLADGSWLPDQAAVESMPFDEMFGDMSNWFPGAETFNETAPGAAFNFGDLGIDWGRNFVQ